MDVDTKLLRDYVAHLAQQPRPAESDILENCRQWAQEHLDSWGWQTRRHPFKATADSGIELNGINIVATHRQHAVEGRRRFVIGAHIDSRVDSPGADDNASAVAGLFELARLLPQDWPETDIDVELVLFDLEENGMLGGAEHARQCRAQGIDLVGMVSLEMLGYCDHGANTQSLPRPLVGKYPDTGNFIAVIGNQNSGPLIETFVAGIQKVPATRVESLQVPENGNLLQASRLSDHSPFWDEGYAALMITDTSFLRNPHYHTATDTPETLDYDFLTAVTAGTVEAVRLLLSR